MDARTYGHPVEHYAESLLVVMLVGVRVRLGGLQRHRASAGACCGAGLIVLLASTDDAA